MSSHLFKPKAESCQGSEKVPGETTERAPANGSLRVNEHRKSMRRKLWPPENEQGENKLTTKLYVPFYTWPDIQ